METANFPSGRKVFYFFPTGTYHQHVVKEIIRNEFEIYTLSDVKKGLPLIFQYNGGIILFYVDALNNYAHGLSVLRDFCRQSSHRSIELFLLTSSPDRVEEIERYMKELGNCSTILLDENPEDSSRELISLLDELNARGQRRYVRFGSNNDEIATIEMIRKNKKFVGSVHDISSAGLSFSLPEGPSFTTRSKLKEFTLNLDGEIGHLSGTITIRRKLPSGLFLYVVMFDKGLAEETRNKLHIIIHGSLQKQFTQRLTSVAVP